MYTVQSCVTKLQDMQGTLIGTDEIFQAKKRFLVVCIILRKVSDLSSPKCHKYDCYRSDCASFPSSLESNVFGKCRQKMGLQDMEKDIIYEVVKH